MSESAPPEGRVTTEVHGHLLTITIDRPAKYNGFTPEMLDQLAAAYTRLEDEDALWCGLLVAEGKHFTAGLELSRFDITKGLSDATQIDPLDLHGRRRTKPVVAAVHGICFTIGIELMLAADLVIAERGVRFAQLEVQRGLMAYGGATIRMVERAGWGNAMRWLLTGDEFDGETALRLGFVQELVDAGEGRARARAIAERICEQAPLAVRASRRSAQLAAEEGAAAAIAAFPEQLAALAGSEDFAEGVQSFRERRAGRYVGR
ncbi:crotonase/enoyl-CoA hydratase family protein [Pseudenhygromyxa sp. WMMC2535]|uniref:crotonase/enoyl-CoA hydratase family protein n=1 Tax=Pseudenhygromyxa sp. WMMC2535 TaxID=2712867 RepID=UPI0015582EEC|nr:crotonase/enoyl-CoA hydratase family protein [Pseudenhygromyxa sp. WMMC2535]NVB39917.1 crotonase/enoyl-CoA hydratase family protein [Pseudenhygromyxa sp. WMMC2535]